MSFDSQDSFYQQASTFISQLHLRTSELANNLSGCYIDHVCYRVSDLARYEVLKKFFLSFSQLLTETPVNGRPIATFQLSHPIPVRGAKPVKVVELPAPKLQSLYVEGFEHIEYVLPTSFSYFLHLNPAFRTAHEIIWKDFNPEMRVKIDAQNVKFHYAPLNEIIALEQKPEAEQKIIVFDLHGTLADPANRVSGTSRIYPEALALIEKYKRKNTPMVIWTSCDLETTNDWLMHWDLQDTFEKVWTSDNLPAKPDVSGLQYITGARPAHLVEYYGDTGTDFHAAQKLGVIFHWAKWNPSLSQHST